MQIGLITVNGRPIGTVSIEVGKNEAPDYKVKNTLLHNTSLTSRDGAEERPFVGQGQMPKGGYHAQHGSQAAPPLSPAPSPAGPRFGGEGDTDPRPAPAYSGAGGRVYGGLASARDRAREELRAKPWLNEKAMHIFAGENPDPTASTALWESAINRMAVRGTTLEKELRHTSEGGYYEGWRDQVSPTTRKVLEASRDRALAYSNVSNYATDNSSGALAARERASGTFTAKTDPINGESFFGPDNRIANHQRAYSALVRESETGRAANPAAAADATSAPSAGAQPGRIPGVEPEAFIMHHTGGRGSVEGVQNTLRERGLGVEYIMDRDGNIIQSGGPGSAHMMRGWGKGEGLSNRNTVGMEVIAKDDNDVTPAQVAAAKAFIARNYPNTPVMGHGLVNPGHKEADEGKTITDAINADRAAAAQKKIAEEQAP